VNDVSESLHDLIDMACDYADAIDNAGIVQILQVVNFTMVSLPSNLHRLFPNVESIRVVNCPRFSSLSTAVTQFRHLTQLSCDGCESLSSLVSLSSLPVESQLKTLAFYRCGLRVTSEDDWAPGMEGLARGRGQDISGVTDNLHILIEGCDSLDSIPPSIGILSETAKDTVILYLKGNKNLRHLPYVLGEIPKLNSLVIDDCPRITRLPWSLSRTGIELSRMDKLISSLGLTNEARGYEPYFTIHPGMLDPYFSVYRKRLCRGLFKLVMLVGRSRKRAIDRLCSPGGIWYERSRESFLSAVADMISYEAEPCSVVSLE
jgi:Leucine-rich repeat (LRR) protein